MSGDEAPMTQPSQARAATKKHVILFLAANPSDTGRLALDREARSIYVELKRSGYRDRFDFVTRWAAEPLDLLRELRELKPTLRRSAEIARGCSSEMTHRPDRLQERVVGDGCRCVVAGPAGIVASGDGRGRCAQEASVLHMPAMVSA